MIELKGTYLENEGKKPVSVLVQFDDDVLHVWHLHDPFYRIALSSDFSIALSNDSGHGRIKLSNGARIETSDHENLERLRKDANGIRGKQTIKTIMLHKTILLSVIIILLAGIWLIATTLPF